MAASFGLVPADFGPAPRRIARAGAIEASGWTAPSGVAVLRVETPRVRADLLPFQGQQIWDAWVDGRRLTMQSQFDGPRATRNYLDNYGGFFLHCGGISLGNPGPGDDHPLHGELPNAPYDSVEIELDELGFALSGATRFTRAFSHDFTARPRLRIGVGETEFLAGIEIENHSAYPLALVYLAHVNFRPMTGGRLTDAVANDRTDVLRRPGPGAALENLTGPLDRNVPGPRGAEAEMLYLMKVRSGANGWTAAAQIHPNGDADVVRWQPSDLPHVTRWIVRRGDEDAMGLALPGTSYPTGMTDIRARGQLANVAPGALWHTELRFGHLPAEDVPRLEDEIAAMRDGAQNHLA